MTDDMLIECLQHTPKLVRLAVGDPKRTDRMTPIVTDKLLVALQSLHCHGTERDAGVRSNLLPKLKFLELSGEYTFKTRNLIKLVKSRWDLPLTEGVSRLCRLTLFDLHFRSRISNAFSTRLSPFQQAGLQVYIPGC
jgi:hypothetical protein